MKFRVARQFFISLLIAISVASPAAAKWYTAESDHFVVYADDSPKDIQRFAEYLERYHAALAYLTNSNDPVPSPSNRVTIFVVGGEKDVQRLAGENSRYIAGFYIPRAGGSIAFVQDIRFLNTDTDFSLIVLLHEYAHHFMIGTSRTALPRWLGEGAAEFFASARFMNDGGISVGRPALHRAGELFELREVKLEELFDNKLYEMNRGKKYDSFYGRSWLLYHYLRFSQERKGQLTKYIANIREGMSATEAASDAFGDFGQLDKELDRYLEQPRMTAYTLKPEMLKIGSVTLRELTPGEAAIMPLRIQSQRGVDSEQAAALVVDVRNIASRFPDDAGALTALAEAEFDSGNDAAAISAADRALAIDPHPQERLRPEGSCAVPHG